MSKNLFRGLSIDSDEENNDGFIEVKSKKSSSKKEEIKEIKKEESEESEYYVLNKGELEKLGYFKKFNSEWNLWYHHELNNWRVDGYRKVFHVKNIKEFWDLHNNIDCLGGITNQHFFFMRDNILPIWEDTANRNGGSWSIKLNDISNVFNVWLKIIMLMVGENIIKDEKLKQNKLVVGLSINMRNQNTCIIKIWNRDSNYNSIKLLNDDIIR